jgi:1,4-dihydroxy-6-naphthoate synthase
VIRRDLGPATTKTVSRILHDSIAHALDHRAEAVEYAKQFGRGLDAKDTDRFVGMYVNQLTLDYGSRGRAALDRFFGDAFDQGLIPQRVAAEFV